MTDDTPPVVERVAALDTDLSPTGVLAVAYLAATDGAATAATIASAVDVSPTGISGALRDTDAVERRERETNTDGRDPYVYDLTAAARSALDTDAPEWTAEAIRGRILRDLATIHYERDLSSATAAQLAREIPGASTAFVAGRLGRLAEGDGPVECVKRETPARYRLVGAGLYVPFRALATDGGADR